MWNLYNCLHALAVELQAMLTEKRITVFLLATDSVSIPTADTVSMLAADTVSIPAAETVSISTTETESIMAAAWMIHGSAAPNI